MDEEYNNQAPDLLHPATPLSKPQPGKAKRLWVYFFIALILAAFLIVRGYVRGSWPSDSTAYDQTTLQPKKWRFFRSIGNFIFNSDNIMEGQTDDRVNILVLGIGGSGHDGPYLSDTNIIISLKPSTNEVAMISIPRDLAVKINGYGYRKINNADAFGEMEKANSGGEYARKIFEETFGITIPYYARVDFKAFAELVDEVGGVTIDVPHSFTDASYPGPNFSYQTINFEAGAQTMNGERALEYTRSRHGNNNEGSDFARSKRQQQVLAALKQKILSVGTYANPIKIQQIITSLNNHVLTNLNFGQIMYLASLAKKTNNGIKHLVLDDSPQGFLTPFTDSVTGAYLLAPKSGTFTEINQAIKNVFNNAALNANEAAAREASVSSTVSAARPSEFASAKIELQNGTWRAGLASRVQQRLELKGFYINSVGNALKRPVNKTAIYLINTNAAADVVNNLKKELNAEIFTSFPDWLNDSYDDPSTAIDEKGVKYKIGTDIIIVLGEDIKE